MVNFLDNLHKAVTKNKSFLCVGLDTDYNKLPVKSKNIQQSIFHFNKQIIDNTSDLVCCYKLNSAFYEKYGGPGIETLKRTIAYINRVPVILDAKRCDISNSSKYYAQYAFEYLKADAVTVIPYMGIDAIEPFFTYKAKFVFVVVLSSNPGAQEFQDYPAKGPVYMKVIKQINKRFNNAGFVFGATKPGYIKKIREQGINNPLLIPGLGTQKGYPAKTVPYAFMNKGIGIFNVSRRIIYAGKGKNYINYIKVTAEKWKCSLFELTKIKI